MLDYGELFADEAKKQPLEDEYWTATGDQKTESETLNNEEAGQTMKSIEFGQMFGDRYGEGSEKMRKLDLWINPRVKALPYPDNHRNS